MAPVRVKTTDSREGRRLRLVDAQLVQNGDVVARAGGLFLRRKEQPSDDVWSSPITMPPLPAEPEEPPEDAHMFSWSYGLNPIEGSPGIGFAEWQQSSGPKYAWMRETRLLIDGAPLTPFTRARWLLDSLGYRRIEVHQRRLHGR